MGKKIRKIVCWLIGCNYICLHRNLRTWEDRTESSTESGWQCTRCDNRRVEQWDA